MILKRKKNSFFLIPLFIIILLIAAKILINLETKFNKNLTDIKQFIKTEGWVTIKANNPYIQGFYFNFIIGLLLYDSRFFDVISSSYKVDHVYSTWDF